MGDLLGVLFILAIIAIILFSVDVYCKVGYMKMEKEDLKSALKREKLNNEHYERLEEINKRHNERLEDINKKRNGFISSNDERLFMLHTGYKLTTEQTRMLLAERTYNKPIVTPYDLDIKYRNLLMYRERYNSLCKLESEQGLTRHQVMMKNMVRDDLDKAKIEFELMYV